MLIYVSEHILTSPYTILTISSKQNINEQWVFLNLPLNPGFHGWRWSQWIKNEGVEGGPKWTQISADVVEQVTFLTV